MENTGSLKKKNQYDFIDLVKFILSLMIVAIHNSSLFNGKIYPWVRIAVPLFFMISAYFLFVKLNKCQTKVDKSSAVKGYVIKNLQLYTFWWAIQLPVSIKTKFDFEAPLYSSVLKFIKRFFVGEGFTAAWFLIAIVLSVIIIYFASKKFNNAVILLGSFLIYIIVILKSAYPYILEKITPLDKAILVYEDIYASLLFSLPAALIWVALGKCFADGGIKLSKSFAAIGAVVFGVLTYAEWYYALLKTGTDDTEYVFALIPLSICLFALILEFKTISVPYAATLRKLSVVLYTTHGASGLACKLVLRHIYPSAGGIFTYFTIVFACIILGLVIIKLQKHIKILKYAI